LITDGSSDIGNTNPRYNNLSKQTCLQRQNVAHPATIPQSIMLGSLLERLCSVYEHEPNKANQLFRGLCIPFILLLVVACTFCNQAVWKLCLFHILIHISKNPATLGV